MKTQIYQTGHSYQFVVAKVKDKISLGIKSQHRFDANSNFVAVLMDSTQIKLLIEDLKEALKDEVRST